MLPPYCRSRVIWWLHCVGFLLCWQRFCPPVSGGTFFVAPAIDSPTLSRVKLLVDLCHSPTVASGLTLVPSPPAVSDTERLEQWSLYITIGCCTLMGPMTLPLGPYVGEWHCHPRQGYQVCISVRPHTARNKWPNLRRNF